MSEDYSPEILARAAHAYQVNRTQWEFLGYSEAIAVAVLAAFFSLERPRNRSQKPLNVLAMVGKSRVQAIAEAVRAQEVAPDESEDSARDDAG